LSAVRHRQGRGRTRGLALLAGLFLAVAAAGCDEGGVTGASGEVRGTVLIEGEVAGTVSVDLSGPVSRSIMTDGAGGFTFPGIPPGAYVVSIRGVPSDASFPATARTAVVQAGQTVSVDFAGNFLRTGAIGGGVRAGTRGVGGATVLLQGLELRSTLTDANGQFSFGGLRAGAYLVELSGLPGSVTFPSVRADVLLSAGETRVVDFQGQAQPTASAVVHSITRRTATGAVESVDPLNVRGQIDVTVRVDPGEDTVVSLDLALGGTNVGRYLFGSGTQGGDFGSGPGGGPAMPGGVPERSPERSPDSVPVGVAKQGPDQAPAPFDIVFSVNTADYDGESGAVRFPNGDRLLTVRLATVEGGSRAWESSVALQLRNVDTVIGTLIPQLGPVAGSEGAEWVGGELRVRVVPVLYTPDRAVGAVTVELRRSGGGGGAPRRVVGSGSGPFHLFFPAMGAPSLGNVAGYRTTAGTVDEVWVVSVLDGVGQPFSGLPRMLVTGLRVDNAPPESGTFGLPRQSGNRDCCLGNWVGVSFSFAEAWTPAPEAGVGGVMATFHVGPSAMPDSALVAEGIEVLLGGDLPASAGNSDYRAVARLRNAFGTSVLLPLAPTDGNTLASGLGAVFGVDVSLPTLAFAAQSLANGTVNPPPGAVWILQVDAGTSGTGPLPARTRVRLLAPGVTGSGACLFPGGSSCPLSVDGLSRTAPTGPDGYLTFDAEVVNRAGNRSTMIASTILRDTTPPQLLVLELAAPPIPGEALRLTSQVSDNVDLHQGRVVLRFGSPANGLLLPFREAFALGTPFDGELVTDATFTATPYLVVSVEGATGGAEGDAPSGIVTPVAAVRTEVMDAAGNSAGGELPLDPGEFGELLGFSASTRGVSGGVAGWRLGAEGDQVCAQGSGSGGSECPGEIPETIILKAAAQGAGGNLEKPFARVHFYLVREGRVEWLGESSAGEQTRDVAGPRGREWSWELRWSPGPDAPEGTATLLALGVDPEGRALRSGELNAVRVVRPE